MKELKVIIKNKLGLHTRAAAMLVENISRYVSDVTIIKEGQEVDGKSIMQITMLAATQGTKLNITAVGSDAEQAVKALTAVLESETSEKK